MRRTRTLIIVVLFLVASLALPAVANTRDVSASCPASSPGGSFRSTGTVLNFQRHTKSGFGSLEYNYTGTQSRTRNYGAGFTGTQWATLWSPNTFSSAFASCPG